MKLRPLSRTADKLVALPAEYIERIQRDELRRHFDANELPFLERELTQLRVKAFEVQFPESKARRFLPLAGDVAASATQFSFKVYTPVGAAKVINPKSNDLPRLELGAREIYCRVVPVGIAYEFGLLELKEAARIGSQLPSIKPRLARDTVERGIDELLCKGSLIDTSGQSSLPIYGLASNADVITAGIIAMQYWIDGGDTADTILGEMTGLCSAVSNRSNGLFTATDLLMPLGKYNYAKDKVYSTQTGDTVLTVFKKNNPGVNVQPWEKLETVGAAGGPRSIAYAKSPEVLEGVIPQEFEMMPAERKGFDLVTDCWATCGGVKIYQPTAVVYGDHATS